MSKDQKSYSSLDGRLPGDPSREDLIERFIRVDQAGEYGAVRIYEGQMSVLGKSESSTIINHMLTQEEAHLETFSKMVGKRQIRPTALLPLWHLAGFALGAGTALMGEKMAMACTVAVEEVIDEHYAAQIEKLEAMGGEEQELSDICKKFRLEELEHRDTAIEHGAEEAAGYEGLTALVKTGSRMAIWLSERI
jgi:ubiquinone biosynthesis monooxygenase Coq7